MPEFNKTEVRFAVDQEFMDRLQRILGESSRTDVAKTALTVLNWAADEVRNGRVILSAQPDGSDVHRLAVPALENRVRPSTSSAIREVEERA